MPLKKEPGLQNTDFPWMRVVSLTLSSSALFAWSPRVHENQTKLATQLVPAPMAALLAAYPEALREGARGIGNDPHQAPSVEDVEDQYRRVLAVSESKKSPQVLVRELGRLAHMVQELTAPGSILGSDPLRNSFETYADERLRSLVLTREPFWAVRADLDPKPKLLEWAQTKYRRHGQLQEHFNSKISRRIGVWDELSVPFALLQLSYSNGVHASANLWILAYRAAGDLWAYPTSARPK